MWHYNPEIGKEMKIHPSMMLQSWMGSDFTNDDIVKESSILEDYTHILDGKKNHRWHGMLYCQHESEAGRRRRMGQAHVLRPGPTACP